MIDYESESDSDITDNNVESAALPTSTSAQLDQHPGPGSRHHQPPSNQPEAAAAGEESGDYYEFASPDESSSAPAPAPMSIPGPSSCRLNPMPINGNDNDHSTGDGEVPEADARFSLSAQSPEEIVMDNHLVLEAVFKKLPPLTLKQIRLVNKKWNEISVNTLIHLKCLGIRLYSSRRSILGVGARKPYELTMPQLHDFNNYYSQPNRKFPVTCVDMELGMVPTGNSNNSNDEMSRFFTLYGSYIKKLMITRGYGCVFTKHPVSKLRELLFKHFPNVECLQIEDLSLTDSPLPLPNVNFLPGPFNVHQWAANPVDPGPVPLPAPLFQQVLHEHAPIPDDEDSSGDDGSESDIGDESDDNQEDFPPALENGLAVRLAPEPEAEDDDSDDSDEEFEEMLMDLPADLQGMAPGGVHANHVQQLHHAQQIHHAQQLHHLAMIAAAAGDIKLFDAGDDQEPNGTGIGSPRSHQLSSLKRLKFVPINYRSVLADLLTSAPNMELLENFQINSVNVIEETRKIHVVKDFIHVPPFNFPHLFRFAALGPKLVNLKICSISPTFEGEGGLEDFVALRKILISSKDSLKSIHCYPFHLFTPHEQELPMPSFSNLKLLSLFYPSVSSDLDAPIFPHGLDLTGVFPNVETVVLDVKEWNQESLRYYFPSDNFDFEPSFEGDIDDLVVQNQVMVQPWRSVTHLILRPCSIDKFGLLALGKKFPNVTRFTAESVHHLFETDDSVWTLPWEKLESLELHGFILQRGFFNMSLDSFFTGISNGKLWDLQRQRMNLVEGEELELDWPRLKTRRAIHDFQHLRQVKIVFDHKGNSDWKLPGDFSTDPHPDITRLSWDYGFKLIPHLSKPVFAFDATKCDPQDVKILLEPLLPFINLGDEPQRGIKRPREM